MRSGSRCSQDTVLKEKSAHTPNNVSKVTEAVHKWLTDFPGAIAVVV